MKTFLQISALCSGMLAIAAVETNLLVTGFLAAAMIVTFTLSEFFASEDG